MDSCCWFGTAEAPFAIVRAITTKTEATGSNYTLNVYSRMLGPTGMREGMKQSGGCPVKWQRKNTSNRAEKGQIGRIKRNI